MKLPSKRKVVSGVVILALLVGAGLIVKHRGHQLYSCYAAEYDLHRDTNFRWFTGRCTATGKDGGQVYVDQLRAFGSDNQDVDTDHGN